MAEREPIQPIVPEPIRIDDDNYAEGHWDYPRRCVDIEMALDVARERVEEWDQRTDPSGWWHERPYWIALHNEVVRLRRELPADVREFLVGMATTWTLQAAQDLLVAVSRGGEGAAAIDAAEARVGAILLLEKYGWEG
jgi:hypothetical protein